LSAFPGEARPKPHQEESQLRQRKKSCRDVGSRIVRVLRINSIHANSV
jgi:hypothetical protein